MFTAFSAVLYPHPVIMKCFPPLLVSKEKGRKDRLYILVPGNSGKLVKKYYGVVGDCSALERYQFDRKLWEVNHPISAKSESATVSDLIKEFLAYAKNRYIKHGRPTGTADNYKQVLTPLKKSYGSLATSDFTLDVLEEYQRSLDSSRRLCRRQVNKAIQAICYVFKWGALHRLNGVRIVPAEIASELRLIQPLRAGYSVSVDHPKKRSVNPADVEAALPHLPPIVADMVRLQILTGARPQEIRLMRCGDFRIIDRDLWYYYPSEYKTEHIDNNKIISIGPRSISILKPRLNGLKKGDYIFSPSRENKANRVFNDFYRRDSYAVAIRRACRRAGVPVFTPYQLRKLRATQVDKLFGAETAAAVLGHSDVATTLRHYIDPRRTEADKVARNFG